MTNKCEICQKKCKNGTALQQHKTAVHPRAKKPSQKVRRSGGGYRNAGIDIAPSRIPPPKGCTITLSGEDRVDAFDVGSSTNVFKMISIGVTVSNRLKAIASTFQRIKWVALTVRVTPQASTIINGGYVCGFIMDPSDQHITAADLSSTQGSQTKKWYETAILKMPPKPDLLYTSSSEEIRLQNPANFWIIGEGKPSSSLTVIVTMNWTVTLSQPTVEHERGASFILPTSVYPIQSNYNVSTSGSTDNNKVNLVDFSSYIPANIKELPGDHYFRVPTFNIEYKEGTGDTGTTQMHFLVYKTSDKKMYYSADGLAISMTQWQSDLPLQCLAPCGTYLKYVGQKNECRVSTVSQSLPSVMDQKSIEHWEILSERLLQMERLLEELKNPLTNTFEIVNKDSLI